MRAEKHRPRHVGTIRTRPRISIAILSSKHRLRPLIPGVLSAQPDAQCKRLCHRASHLRAAHRSLEKPRASEIPMLPVSSGINVKPAWACHHICIRAWDCAAATLSVPCQQESWRMHWMPDQARPLLRSFASARAPVEPLKHVPSWPSSACCTRDATRSL